MKSVILAALFVIGFVGLTEAFIGARVTAHNNVNQAEYDAFVKTMEAFPIDGLYKDGSLNCKLLIQNVKAVTPGRYACMGHSSNSGRQVRVDGGQKYLIGNTSGWDWVLFKFE